MKLTYVDGILDFKSALALIPNLDCPIAWKWNSLSSRVCLPFYSIVKYSKSVCVVDKTAFIQPYSGVPLSTWTETGRLPELGLLVEVPLATTSTLTRLNGLRTSCEIFSKSFTSGYSLVIASRVSVDTKLKHSLDLRFNTPFFDRGNFPDEVKNGTGTIPLTNPWTDRGNSAPFDQRKIASLTWPLGTMAKMKFSFDRLLSYHERRRWRVCNFTLGNIRLLWLIFTYFIAPMATSLMALVANRGWMDRTVRLCHIYDNRRCVLTIDCSTAAMRDFALAQDQWYPTWPANPEERGLVVSVIFPLLRSV